MQPVNSQQTLRMFAVIGSVLGAGLVGRASLAGPPAPPMGSWSAPTIDRWFDPFNASPGTRQTISTFGSTPGDSLFDSRDGQFYMVFDTDDQIPTGDWLGSNLIVAEARVTIMVVNDVAVYDPTPDAWQCFVGEADADWQADVDAGQPIELFAAGYRNDWTAATFVEAGPFAPTGASVLLPGVRNVFLGESDLDGAVTDASSHVREDRDAQSLAVAACSTVAPGDILTNGSVLTFEIDCSVPQTQAYLAANLQAGRLPLVASSLTFVVQGGGDYPAFYSKENPLVILGAASAATLDVTLGYSCAPADIDCSGAIEGADLAMLLGNWGNPGGDGGNTDLDGSGTTDGADMAILLGAWE